MTTSPALSHDLEVGGIRDSADALAAVQLLARGMRDSPMHVAVFGHDPERRERALQGLFAGLFTTPRMQPFCLRRNGEMVAVAGVASPGRCRPTPREALRGVPVVTRLGPMTMARMATWLKAWAGRDPSEAHSHLGPVAVDRHLQGQGMGTVLLEEYCRRLDAAGEVSYLETDKEINVRFYGRAGFEVVDEADVLGVPNWFMRRAPRG